MPHVDLVVMGQLTLLATLLAEFLAALTANDDARQLQRFMLPLCLLEGIVLLAGAGGRGDVALYGALLTVVPFMLIAIDEASEAVARSIIRRYTAKAEKLATASAEPQAEP